MIKKQDRLTYETTERKISDSEICRETIIKLNNKIIARSKERIKLRRR